MEKIFRNILCIDLKSFFASVECVDRHLNPFLTPLVVANSHQGNGAITLAVTPYLKNLGIKGRTRLYEIPKNISYQIVNPRMKRYVEMSKKVVQIYLDFVSVEDLHIYSIDECFLDVTDYLSYYKMSVECLAQKILETIEKKTGLTATCGIGPNLFLAKVAMDTEAKKYKNGIAQWTYDDVPTKLWTITPLSKIWGIGSRMEKRLHNLGIFTLEDLAKKDPYYLKQKFGILGYELWDHANGIDDAVIKNFKQAKEKSLSHSQVLMRDYYGDEILLLIKEMLEVLCKRLRNAQVEATHIGFGLSYSKVIGGGFYHSTTLETSSDLASDFYPYCVTLFEEFYEDAPVRKIHISLGGLVKKQGIQLNLFESLEQKEKDEKMVQVVDALSEKFGKNSLLYATSLLSYSTIRSQNEKLGGHHE